MKNDVIHGRWYVRPPTLDIQSKDNSNPPETNLKKSGSINEQLQKMFTIVDKEKETKPKVSTKTKGNIDRLLSNKKKK